LKKRGFLKEKTNWLQFLKGVAQHSVELAKKEGEMKARGKTGSKERES